MLFQPMCMSLGMAFINDLLNILRCLPARKDIFLKELSKN